MRVRSTVLAIFSLLAASLLAGAPTLHAGSSADEACAPTPKSPLVVNVKDKGAKGDGKTDDTASIQAAIDEVAGTGGTVLVPDGIYMVEVAPRPRLSLKSDMTLKLAENATLKAIPTDDEKSSVLTIAGVSNVAVIGGTLEGERDEHKGKKDKRGGWGMGLYIRDGAEHILIAGVTARKMWADGFYVSGASDVTFCEVTADNNRRQGLSIIEADGLVVTELGVQEHRQGRGLAPASISSPTNATRHHQCEDRELEIHRQCRSGNPDRRQERAPCRKSSSRATCSRAIGRSSPRTRRRWWRRRSAAIDRSYPRRTPSNEPQRLCRPDRSHGASKRLRGRRPTCASRSRGRRRRRNKKK